MRYLFLRLFSLCITLCTCAYPVSALSEDLALFEEGHCPHETAPRSNVWNTDDTDASLLNPNYKRVAITFDDAPASTLERLISVFASYNEENPDCPAFASLFCNGIRIQSSTMHSLTSAYAIGWELGNHGYTHHDFNKFTFFKAEEEIEKTDKLLCKIDGKRRHLFRPPFGNLDKAVQAKLEMPIIYWTIDTLDWTCTPVEEIENKVLNNVFDGAIILMHDGYENTVQAVKRLLPALKERGYQCVSISQMAKAQKQTLFNGKGYIRIRKAKA